MTYFRRGVSFIYIVVLATFNLSKCMDDLDDCNRKPLQTKTIGLLPDDRFILEIDKADNTYIPERSYTVNLRSRDNDTKFIAFTIYAVGDTKYNEKNPHKKISLDPGSITSSPDVDDMDTISSAVCSNTVLQSNVQPKTSVKALWKAPPKGNKCVSLYAYVAVKPDVWYDSKGPLTKRVCEDSRKHEDMKPPDNENCRACYEARYELTFEGTWSYNTHSSSDMFPVTRDLARFSDIVGASHNNNFYLFRDGMPASEGLQMLAEQGNTTKLEEEILKKLGTNVRTLIKATGPPRPSMSTVSSFRTSPHHRYISIAAAILPSPDWFLGVYNMELCDITTNDWAKHVVLNLYPMDAGSDSGQTFESSNEPTRPPGAVGRAFARVPIEMMRPFARIIVNLVRTYPKSYCDENTYQLGGEDDGEKVPETSEEIENDNRYENHEPRTTSTTTTSQPPVADPESNRECQVTTWEEWLPCDGLCENNMLLGHQMRFRYFMVDGQVIGKDYKEDESSDKDVPKECYESTPTTEFQKCNDTCEAVTEEPEAERQLGTNRLKPGQVWG